MKYVTAIFIIILLVLFNFLRIEPIVEYKVLKVKNADEIYLDLNKNGKVDKDELVKIYNICAFHPEFNKNTWYQAKLCGCYRGEIAAVGLYAKEFAEKLLLNKTVVVEFKEIEKHSIKNYSMAKVYLDGEDYARTLLNMGFATPRKKDLSYVKELNFVKLRENIERAEKEKIRIINTKNNTYHKIDCKFGGKAKTAKAVKPTSLIGNEKPCQYCILGKQPKKYRKHKKRKLTPNNYDFYMGKMGFYFTDFNKRTTPDNGCSAKSCKLLLRKINNAKESIDFAVYGFADQPKVVEALVAAQKRGVTVRWVTDANSKGNNIYSEVKNVQKLLPNYKTDNHSLPAFVENQSEYKNAIMHNKFFIFDKKAVWIASANISKTDLADFNANTIVWVNSKPVANIFQHEFNQMYYGRFHFLKDKTTNNENINVDEYNTVSVYFSPQDDIATTQIIPKINNAKNYVYISSFIITHKGIQDALVNAKQRGVDVKIIIDATSANGRYSVHGKLRERGVAVKVENKAGKMHSKTLVIDDAYIIAGSMNLTKSGNNINDESVLVVESPRAAKNFKRHFLYLYNSIPDIWLTKTPQAESPDSIGSCFDGVDNDFDKLVDAKDPVCVGAKK